MSAPAPELGQSSTLAETRLGGVATIRRRRSLTASQLSALAHRQLGLVTPDSVLAHGATLAALRRRGLVKGATAELTPLGERVCRLLDRAAATVGVDGPRTRSLH